jgi:D-amino-acid dehydrogenase
MKVIVLGSGVIGVTTAYFLARAGHQVLVLDKNQYSALGCSEANGGQLSYSHIETWAAKSSLFSILKAAVVPNSFLSLSKFANKKFLKWFYEFYQNSKVAKSHENSRRLFRLTSYSKEVLNEILSEEKDLKFDYKNEGTLHFYREQKKLDSAIKDAEFVSSIGVKTQILTAEECVRKEPALIKLFDEKKLAGGIFYEMDGSGNGLLFVRALEKICKEKYGVTFEYDTEVKNLLTNHKKITGINTSKGVYVAHKYVYALGANGDNLLKGVRVETKIYPLKGYSLSIAADEEFIAPKMALTDTENKVVYSRLGKIFRAAGTVEICGLSSKKNKKNLAFLKATVCNSFSDFGNINEMTDWSGFRPFRPNSLPLICEVKKYGNLLLNTGHGSLGWTLSAGSAKILSDLVSDQKDERFGFLEEELEEN